VPGSSGGSIGLGFAIPVDLADGLADELIADGRATRPTFGMQLQAIPEDIARATGGSPGLFVTAVTSGGPADQAGLQTGDVILEIDGEPAQNADALIVKTLKMTAGDTIRITYERAGASNTTDLTLAAGESG
jgi:putative serine protease PepD